MNRSRRDGTKTVDYDAGRFSSLLDRHYSVAQHGNVVIYNSPGITAATRDIVELGRPGRLLVNHWHEAMYGAPDLNVPIFVHENDRGQTDLPIAGTFSKREKIADDLEVIPTPGHTLGATMFLWDNGEHRLLFPGDSIWVQGGEWKAVLLAERDRETYLASLSLLMDLDFDILVPWGSEEGQPMATASPVLRRMKNLEGSSIAFRLEGTGKRRGSDGHDRNVCRSCAYSVAIDISYSDAITPAWTHAKHWWLRP